MAERYGSDALAAAHETARGLTQAGAMPNRTMRTFDGMCLTPVAEMTPENIRLRGISLKLPAPVARNGPGAVA